MTAQDLEKLLAEVTPDWRPGGRFKAVISDGITGWDDTETVAGYRGHLVCESVNHPAIMELICMAPALARKVIAAESLYDSLNGMIKAYSEPDKLLCCNGHMCGCRGASERDYADYWATEAIKAWEAAQ